jgi:hypothetical protein
MIAAVVASMTTPNLLRSRVAANEASAVGSVRTINTAAETYKAQHPGEGYPQTLSDFAPYVDPVLANGVKSGYRFRYVPGTRDVDGAVKAFRVEATPVEEGKTGQRSYIGSELGQISYRPAASSPEAPLDGASSPQPEQQPALQSRRMIRKGSVNLIVSEPASVAERIRAIAYRFGGYVDSVRLSEQGAGATQASIAIRVPASRFDEVRREVRALGDRVNNEQDDARDVTGQYVDLESSLRNFHAEEAQYLEIMRRSGSIKDTLAVAERLADVRGRIEHTQGQLNLMQHQTEMAVLEVTLGTEAVAQPVDVRWRPLAIAKAAFWDAANDLTTYANFLIAVAFRLPVYLLWILTVLAASFGSWRVLRWAWRRLIAAPVPAS